MNSAPTHGGHDYNKMHAAICKLATTVVGEDGRCAYCGLRLAQIKKGKINHEPFCPTAIAQEALR